MQNTGIERYRFLDLYRGIIVLFMVEGHVVRELLTPDLKASQFFGFHEVFHGVTAPGFLFGAGFTLAVATQRRWIQSVSLGSHFFRRVWRSIALILIGYSLHLPYLSLQKTITVATVEEWTNLLSFDVLQCIGLGLLFIRLLLIIIKQERWFIISLIVFLLAIVYYTPFLWSHQTQYSLPIFLSAAIQGSTGSPFPIFPYVGFIFAGTFIAWLFLRYSQKNKEKQFVTWLMFIGICLIGCSIILDLLPYQTYTEYRYWYTSPNFFWLRLGILLVMLSSLWFFEELLSIKYEAGGWFPKWLTVIGIESLFMYIAHLLLLYGWVTNVEFNLRWIRSGRLNLFESLCATVLLTLILIPMSYLWHYIKKQHPILAKGILWWLGCSLAWSFFFNPY